MTMASAGAPPVPLEGVTLLVTGATGQVGHELAQTLSCTGARVVLALRAPRDGRHLGLPAVALDLEDLASVERVVHAVAPQIVVNAAAYTQVDKAESEPDRAARVNGEAVGVLAGVLRAIGGAVIHFSTDYVYGVDHDRPIREDEPLGPLNAYGRSKAAGETALAAAGIPAIVLRSSWVYGLHGANFVKTMLRLGGERESLNVVADQHGAPTSARLLALATLQILLTCGLDGGGGWREGFATRAGTYNLAASGTTTWADFARFIFTTARAQGASLTVADVKAIPTSAYPTPARRPLNSRLDLTRIRTAFGVVPAPWEEGVEQLLAQLVRTLPRGA